MTKPTRYITRRIGEGKTLREAKRSLKRIIARKLFRLLQRHAWTTVDQPLQALDGA